MTSSPTVFSDRWSLTASAGQPPVIEWNVAADARLPHSDHVEMSGRTVSVIVRYAVQADRMLAVTRRIFWPQLRTREGDVRGYTWRDYADAPAFLVDGKTFSVESLPVTQVSLDGLLTFTYAPVKGVRFTCTLFPSRTRRCVIENWRAVNTSATPLPVALVAVSQEEEASGVYGPYTLRVNWADASSVPIALAPGETATFTRIFSARRADEPDFADLNGEVEEQERRAFIRRITTLPENALLTTPDPIVNAAFAFAKVRAAESLFETARMGLVHSPGGGNYYGGIWANDQAEYANPLFAFLAEPDANEAALNAYRIFAGYMGPDYKPLPTSLEMEGTIEYHAGGDRGDAAMIASGLSRYLLTRGDTRLATEFWPALEWCLEYCHRKTNAHGVIESDTDELEGRFPTGDANLSTSSLCYDGLRRAADLARSLGKSDVAGTYDRRADTLATAIERYFGATVEGFSTYRYYQGNTTLRAWICLPLCFGIAAGKRQTETINALFSPRLWTADGLATEAGDKVFWDRSTLYGLRGVFYAGATEAAFAHFLPYTRRRLLGEHVPYPVEAYPENAQSHLSAESALYCRVVIEGLLGLLPTGLRSFSITPRLPEAWNFTTLSLSIAGQAVAVDIRRAKTNLHVRVSVGEKILQDMTITPGSTLNTEVPGTS